MKYIQIDWNKLVGKTIVLQSTDIGINSIYKVGKVYDDIIILFDEEWIEDTFDHCMIGRIFYRVAGILDTEMHKNYHRNGDYQNGIEYILEGTIQRTQIETNYLGK